MNCKPGQLAIIVAALRTPENIGRIVRVVKPAVYGDGFLMLDGHLITLDPEPATAIWRVKDDRPLKWRGTNGHVFEGYEIAADDRFLRPVEGLPLDEDVRDEVSA